MHPLEQKIAAARAAGRLAVIPFITAGFPHPQDFWEHLGEIDSAGTDIIEIGVPFSDPVADGPVVEEASRRSLAYGVNLDDLLAELAVRRGRYQARLVLMGYFNPFYQFGLERLARQAAQAGVAGFIIPDLPLEETAELKRILHSANIALIPLIGPNTSLGRMRMYAEDAEGYAYVVSVMGVTGERSNLAQAVGATIARAREAFSIPLALGFGLRHPEQLAALPDGCGPDAAVIGSALLTHIDSGKRASDFLAPWLNAGTAPIRK